MASLDFKSVAAAALDLAPVLLPDWLGGQRRGHEWVGERKANGGLGDSWCVNLKTGIWGHFSGDERGADLIDLYAALNHLDLGAACREVASQVGLTDGAAPRTLPNRPQAPVDGHAEPIPDNAPPLTHHASLGTPTVYAYGDAFRVVRYDSPAGKTFKQYTWRAGKWSPTGYPTPRPLYNVHELYKFPTSTVIIVEGEKCVEAARHVLQLSLIHI